MSGHAEVITAMEAFDRADEDVVALSDRAFYRRWVLANGWAVAAALGTTFVLAGLFTPSYDAWAGWGRLLGVVAATVAAGVVLEGGIVGYAQARVLSARRPDIPRRSWVLATAAGAGLAWTLALVLRVLMTLSPPAGGMVEVPGLRVQLLMVDAVGFLVGPAFVLFQWLLLRRYAGGAASWLWAGGVAWAGGLRVIFLGVGLLPWHLTPLQWTLARFAICALAGLAVGAITGPFLRRITLRTG